MSQLKIFYSWQSDAPQVTNRDFIKTCLEYSVISIQSPVVPDGIVIDQDTLNTPGAANIASTIFSKIKACDCFVADVTPVFSKSFEDRPAKFFSNPNVTMELGFALATHTWNKVILMWNLEFGPIELAPADFRNHMTICYKVANHHEAELQLPPTAEKLATALRTVFQQSKSNAEKMLNDRREQILKQLREFYIQSHDNKPPALVARMSWPPIAWINEQLAAYKEDFTVSEYQGDPRRLTIDPR